MQAVSESPSNAVVSVPYARRPAKRGNAARLLWIGGGLIGLTVLVAGLVGDGPGLLERLFGRSAGEGAFYTVEAKDLSSWLTESGELTPRQSVNLKCQTEGDNTILRLVEESTKVKKGDVLVVLASDDLTERLEREEIELLKIRSSYEAAVQDLEITRNENASREKAAKIEFLVAELEEEKYLKGDWAKAIKSADIDIRQTELEIERKKDERRKKQDLHDKGFVNKSIVDQLEFELEKLGMTLDVRKLAKQILIEYDRPKVEMQKRSAVEQAGEELERGRKRAASREKQAQARVEEQKRLLAMREGRVERLKEQIAKCIIRAPIDGIVQYPTERMGMRGSDRRIGIGERVREGQTLVVLPDTSQMLVKTRVHEADRHKVKVGQLCYVSVPAVPGKVFTGKVAKIARYADSAHRWLNPELKEHTTEILLDDVHEAISPGDTAEVKIIIGEKQNVLQVPVQSVYSRGSRSFAFVKSGRSIKPVEIKIGESSTTMVEVVEGLSSGDQVALHVGEELLAALPAPSTADIEMQKKAQAERQARMRAEQRPGAGERGGRRMGEAGRSGPPAGGMRRGRGAGNRPPSGSGSDGSGKK